ncbi:MAG: transglycosylase domain-containing protein [Thermoflexaceae bacterium]|nr:transglycosylase domain-containing protein [Thermoflexaceae bacterium]
MKKIRKYILITILGIAAVMLLTAACIFMPVLKELMQLKEQAEVIIQAGDSSDFTKSRTSVVYDCNNEVLLTYSGEKDLYYVEIDEIPQILRDAFIVMEDREFYSHFGVDVKAVIRAAVANYNADEIVQGASTITQQLARNIYLNQDVNWERKILEAFMAMELEDKYSKDEILEFYLNNIYFGNGYYGVEAAAKGYLNKSVSELTNGECIFLAAIPNNPSRYDPILHEDNTVERSRLILQKLHENGKIEDLDYLLLSGDEANPFVLDFDKNVWKQEWNTSTADSYVYTYVTYCAVRYLMEQNGFVFKNDFATEEELENYDKSYDAWYTYYQQALYSGGYYIYTSIDMNMQDLLQANVDRIIAENDTEYAMYLTGETKEIQNNPLQASAVTIDNETGLVTAIVGGRTENSFGYGFNRAYQSFRQPGSAIKPLNVYGPYLCMGHSTEEKVYDMYDVNGPKNAGGAYAGEITLRDAVRSSKNTIAWQIYRFITPQTGCEYLMRLGFKKVYMDKKYMSGALGGFTYGVSTEEMTAGFHAIYNDGVYNPPSCIRTISNTPVDNGKTEQKQIYVYTENAARQLTSMLRTVVEEGTGQRAQLTGHEAAGKTGTTNSNKDMWFVGYTAYYTTGVWVGYDSPEEISMENGNLACTIWHDYMEKIHYGLIPKTFTEGSRVEPEINTVLTDLAQVPYEPEEGEPDFENLWDNDMDALILAEEDAKENSGGDADATVSGGDGDASIRGGDADAAVTGGDGDVSIRGGDADATVTGGDEDAPVNDHDLSKLP